MRKLNLILGSLLMLLLFSCSNLFEQNEKSGDTKTHANLVLKINAGGNGNARTITSYKGLNVSEITDWNIQFFNAENEEVEAENISEEDSYSFNLLAGVYTVKVSSIITDSASKPHTIYGEKTIEILADDIVSETVYVGLKKAGGTGTFGEFTVNIPKDALLPKADTETYTFSANLIPANLEGESLPLEPTFTQGTDFSTVTIAALSNIPSGYYYLEISYTAGDSEEELRLEDSLVEIADDETVTGSINAIDPKYNRSYYATNDIFAEGNGIKATNPIYLGKLFEVLHFGGTWKSATINMTEIPLIDVASMDFENPVEFSCLTDSSNGRFSISENKIVLTEGSVGLSLETSESSSIVNIQNVDYLESVEIDYLNSISLNFEDVNLEEEKIVKISVTGDYYNKYYYFDDETSVPFATVKYAEGSKKIKFKCENSDYAVVSKITADGEEYFTADFGSVGIGVDEAIPDFEIAAFNNEVEFTEDDKIPYESSKLKFTPSVTLAEYTKLFWTINDNSVYLKEELDSSTPFEVDLTTLSFYINTNGTNVVKCRAVNGNLMKEASFVLNVETGSVFYIKNNVTYNELYDANDFYGKSLGKCVAVAGDNQFYTFVNNKIIYFDGNEWNEDLYSNYDLDNDVVAMAYDRATKYLYVETKVFDFDVYTYTFYLNVINTAVAQPEAKVPVTKVEIGDNTADAPVFTTFAVNDNKLYGTTMYYDDDYTSPTYGDNYKKDISYCTVNVTLDETTGLVESVELGERKSVTIPFTFGFALAESRITDFYINGSNLYYLYKEAESDFSTNKFAFRGFVGRVDIASNTIDSTYKLGWYDGDSINNHGISCIYPGPASTGFENFFGPYRIINIKKEDEIVIEDYGFYVSDEKRYKYKGRFVTVNLSEKSASAKDTDVRFGSLPASSLNGWEEE